MWNVLRRLLGDDESRYAARLEQICAPLTCTPGKTLQMPCGDSTRVVIRPREHNIPGFRFSDHKRVTDHDVEDVESGRVGFYRWFLSEDTYVHVIVRDGNPVEVDALFATAAMKQQRQPLAGLPTSMPWDIAESTGGTFVGTEFSDRCALLFRFIGEDLANVMLTLPEEQSSPSKEEDIADMLNDDMHLAHISKRTKIQVTSRNGKPVSFVAGKPSTFFEGPVAPL